MMRRPSVVQRLAAAFVLVLGAAATAGAELVHLTTGRVVSVRSVDFEGDRATLALRAGGEISCRRSLIAKVEPDEIAPAPTAAAAPVPVGSRVEAGGRFDRLIAAAAQRYGLDARLLHAVIRAESNYAPRARSPKGARGLMQLMPAVARAYGVDDPDDPAANIDAGARHLRRLVGRYPLDRALAAYNAGEGAVDRHNGIPPYPETTAYVSAILQELSAPSGR
jgi:soluble lytic murein transglycosylase-like protein